MNKNETVVTFASRKAIGDTLVNLGEFEVRTSTNDKKPMQYRGFSKLKVDTIFNAIMMKCHVSLNGTKCIMAKGFKFKVKA